MIDINYLRDYAERAKELLARKNVQPAFIDRCIEVDRVWREKTQAVEELRAHLKQLSEQRDIVAAKKVKAQIKVAAVELAATTEERDRLFQQIPNIPDSEWPVGKDESANRVLRVVGKPPQFDFEPKDYLTLAEQLGIIDVARAAKVSGSRFGYLFGAAALLEFALIQFALSRLVKHGFRPVVPPQMIRPEVYRGMGRLAGAEAEERYYLPKDDLYLIGSAEHTMGPIHMNEVLDEESLPRRYVGFSTCFRREAGSYGKDTKGILRVHQFDKVEMFSFVCPEASKDEHLFLLSLQEALMQELQLHYRVVQNCTGDMGLPDAAQYDIEVWLPGQGLSTGSGRGTFRESHSCSNTTDFQARGINAKYRAKDGKAKLVHMLNATGLAIGRIIIAIIEQYQQKDGSIMVPKALQQYTGFDRIQKML